MNSVSEPSLALRRFRIWLAIFMAGLMRNKWVITFGLIAGAGVVPLALIAGPIRGIPFGWRLIVS